jgi:hypothetical protein
MQWGSLEQCGWGLDVQHEVLPPGHGIDGMGPLLWQVNGL